MKKKNKNHKKYIYITIIAVICALLINFFTLEEPKEIIKEIGFNKIQTIKDNETQLDFIIKNITETYVLEGEDHEDYSEIGKFVRIDYEILNKGLKEINLSKIDMKLRDSNLTSYEVSGEIYHLNNTLDKKKVLNNDESYSAQTLFEVLNSSTIFKLEIKHEELNNETLIFNLN